MKEDYRIGSEVEWLKHSNDELASLVKKREKQARRWRFLAVLLVLALAWVLYRFTRHQPLNQLF